MKQTCRNIIFISGLLLPVLLCAQQKDTLPEVRVQNDIENNGESPRPIQQLDRKTLEKLNSTSVAEATRFFSGVLLKDYGGLGGMKTISVRSLGSGYTGVMYDGVLLSDVQSGQIDLGKISTSNIESITLYNGQPLAVLIPAKSFASGSMLDLQTFANDISNKKKKWTGMAILKAGSFNFFNPSASIRYSKNGFSQMLNAEWQSAKGNYTYKAYELDGSIKRRTNADIQSLRLEYDASYQWKANKLQLKGYHYNSNRGLPGAVTLYTIGGKERLDDKNSFAQAIFKTSVSSKSKLMLLMKYAHQYNFYKDPNTSYGPQGLENRFTQKEYYVSAAYSYKINKAFSASYASDYVKNTLIAQGQFATPFAFPSRQSTFNNILVDAKWSRLHLQANALHIYQTEVVKNGPASSNISKLNPSISLSAQPFKTKEILVRFFYKNLFKTPTFNDVYYPYVGNADLRPEKAVQYNAGIVWKKDSSSVNMAFEAGIDFYISDVKDKIIAVPSQNLFRWTMLNFSRVYAKGLDISLQAKKVINAATLMARITYNYQEAKEADKNSPYYNVQIPYTPLHSGSVHLQAMFKKMDIAVNSVLSSYRYKLGDMIPDNLVKEWATIDVHAAYRFTMKTNAARVFVELNNLLNSQYDIVKFYPMPRFNYRLGVAANF